MADCLIFLTFSAQLCTVFDSTTPYPAAASLTGFLVGCCIGVLPSETPIIAVHPPVQSSTVQEATDLSGVPPEYHDLGYVFCKSRAKALPMTKRQTRLDPYATVFIDEYIQGERMVKEQTSQLANMQARTKWARARQKRSRKKVLNTQRETK